LDGAWKDEPLASAKIKFKDKQIDLTRRFILVNLETSCAAFVLAIRSIAVNSRTQRPAGNPSRGSSAA
jgi:hypothetical protein